MITASGGVDNDQDNESETFFSDYKWQHKLPSIKTVFTIGTTNELVLARSDLFQGNNFRKNHSIFSQLDRKFILNLSFGSRFDYFQIGSEQKYLIDGDSINRYESSKPVFRGQPTLNI